MWLEPKLLRYLRQKPDWTVNETIHFQLVRVRSSKRNLELEVKLTSGEARYHQDVEEVILEHFKHVLGTYFQYRKRLRLIV